MIKGDFCFNVKKEYEKEYEKAKKWREKSRAINSCGGDGSRIIPPAASWIRDAGVESDLTDGRFTTRSLNKNRF